METLRPPTEPAPELYRCPVRRRYAWQLMRYGPPMARWLRDLHAAAGDEAAATRRLAELLRVAEEETAYYAEAFAEAGVHWRDLRGRGDLAQFPSLARATLQERHLDLFSRRMTAGRMEEGWLGGTSGSTGEPVRFFMDAESIHFFTTFIRYLWELHRLGPLPRVGSAGIVLLCALPRSAIYQTRMPLFRWTLFRKLHWAEPDAGRTLDRLAPAVVTGDPGSLERFAEALASGETKAKPRLILSSAFPLPDALAEQLREATGATVVDYYSMAETGPVAWKCTAGTQRFHVLEGAVEVEEDRGELLVTNLRNRLFPLVRYRTGDLVGLDGESSRCRCGAYGRSLVRFEGRIASRFMAADGTRVDPSQLQPLLSRLALRQFQLVQVSADEVLLRYFADRALEAGATAEVKRALPRLLRGEVRLTVEHCEAPLFQRGEKPIVYRTRIAS